MIYVVNSVILSFEQFILGFQNSFDYQFKNIVSIEERITKGGFKCIWNLDLERA